MLPNALADTGPYAGVWSHLKSIDYALQRTLFAAPNNDKLTALDHERIKALADILNHAQMTSVSNDDLLGISMAAGPAFVETMDLREKLESMDVIKAWKGSSKMGFDTKLRRLIDIINGFIEKNSSALFAKDVPVEEFNLLRKVVQHLLSDAEASLQY